MYKVYNIYTDKVIKTLATYDGAYNVAQELNAAKNEYMYDFTAV